MSVSATVSSACVLTPLSGAVSPSSANAPTGRVDAIMHAASAALMNRILFLRIVLAPLFFTFFFGPSPLEKTTSHLHFTPLPL